MMKEVIQHIEIEPSVGYLNFIGAPKEHTTTDDSQTLKGNIRLKLKKSMKAKMMIVKFKGHSQVHNYNTTTTAAADQYTMSIPLLPKLKTKVLSKSTTFPTGDHTIPWELEIPNIYARSFLAHKRGSIQYKVELKVSFGINKKSITLSHPIILYRHLVASVEMMSDIPTKRFEHTTNKFQYRIEAPRIICVEQEKFPVLIRYNKPVKFIYTQIIQTEIYRGRHVSRAEIDMAITASKKNSTIMSGQTYESFKNGDSGLSKFFKRIQPVTLNTMDPQQQQQEQQELPILLLHELNSLLTPGIESPLVAIYHQLEITFNFGLHQEEIRAKIPVLVSSVPSSTVQENKKTRKKKYEIENQLHTCPFSTELIDTSSTKDTLYYHTLNDNSSTITQVSSSSSSSDTNCSLLKKTVSDQNLKPKDIQRTGSMTPPSPTNRPKMLDTQLANTLKSSITTPMTSPMTPNKFIDYSQPLTDATAFTGLPPPPRRARKKESIQEDFSNRRTITTRHSRPNSPTISLHTPPPYSYEKYNNHQQQQDTWMGVVPTASSSSRTTTVRLLNQSKSSGTSSTSSNSRIQQKRRSNSIDYSKLVKNHYVCAELPPIPPPITRQRLPSIPTAAEEKEEHRKTRMYYEDESDEEEDEAEIYNFFLQQL